MLKVLFLYAPNDAPTALCCVSAASAIMQSGLFGIVGKFPARYITATVGGQALGGVLAAVAEIVSLWLGATPIRSALVYFIMADTFILFSIFAYILLSRTVRFALLYVCMFMFYIIVSNSVL